MNPFIAFHFSILLNPGKSIRIAAALKSVSKEDWRERSIVESLTIFRCRSFNERQATWTQGRTRRIRDRWRSGRNGNACSREIAAGSISNSATERATWLSPVPPRWIRAATNPHLFNASRPPSLRRKEGSNDTYFSILSAFRSRITINFATKVFYSNIYEANQQRDRFLSRKITQKGAVHSRFVMAWTVDVCQSPSITEKKL